jgi:hypothetical protein
VLCFKVETRLAEIHTNYSLGMYKSRAPSVPGDQILYCGSGIPRNFFKVGGGRCSTNAVEDRGQRERGFGVSSLLVRGSAQFANE